MKNRNHYAPVHRKSAVSVQTNQLFGSFYSEAIVIFFLVSFFFLTMMFAVVYNSLSQAAAEFNNSSNHTISQNIKNSVGNLETESELAAPRNYSRGTAPSSVYRNGKDRSAGIQFSIFPVQGRMTNSYGFRSNPFGTGETEFHAGLDVAAPTGTPVVAAADGIVVFSGVKGGYGNVVIIEHAGNEVVTRYGHLSQLNVKAGDVVAGGTLIGLVGSTGRSTGPHLHYEIRIDGKAQHPLNFYARNR